MNMLAKLPPLRLAGSGASAPLLQPYMRERSRLRSWPSKAAFFAFLGLFSLIYGFLIAVFPYWLYLYLALPLTLLGLATIWALPSTDRHPGRGLEVLFFAFTIGLLTWPNYIALAIPGLPWITVQRLFLMPAALVMLVALSTSRPMRREMRQSLAGAPLLHALFLLFTAVQVVTVFNGGHAGGALNRLLSQQLNWTLIFYLSVFLFRRPELVDRWVRTIVLCAVFASVIALIEYKLQRQPWVGHIPSFLSVADETVDYILNGDKERFVGGYRASSVFVTPMNLSEFLGLACVLSVHLAVTARTVLGRVSWAATLIPIFAALVVADSRIGFIGFFGACLGYLFFWGWRRWRERPRDPVGALVTLAYPAVIVFFFTLSLFWLRLYRKIWGGGQYQASTDARKEQWALFWPKFFKWPFGYGTGNGGQVLGYYSPGGKLTVDSYIISTGLDYGILGLVGFFGMLAVAIWVAGRRALDYRQPTIFIPLALFFGLFGLMKTVLSQENEHALLFMALGMLVALTPRLAPAAPRRLSAWRWHERRG